MIRHTTLGRLLLLTGIVATAAHAGIIDLTITGSDTGGIAIAVSATGLITGITGTFDGSTISSLDTVGEFGNNDNEYFSTLPPFDNEGLSFALSTPDTYGYTYINFWTPLPLATEPYVYATTQDTINTGKAAMAHSVPMRLQSPPSRVQSASR